MFMCLSNTNLLKNLLISKTNTIMENFIKPVDINKLLSKVKVETVYGFCRCCLTEGSHREITKAYYDANLSETYSDMILDTFNLFLSTNSNLSTLICTPCIERLRDAKKFKDLIMKTDKHLIESLQGYQNDEIETAPAPPTQEQPSNLEATVEIKMEVNDEPEQEEEPQHEDERLPYTEQETEEHGTMKEIKVEFEGYDANDSEATESETNRTRIEPNRIEIDIQPLDVEINTVKIDTEPEQIDVKPIINVTNENAKQTDKKTKNKRKGKRAKKSRPRDDDTDSDDSSSLAMLSSIQKRQELHNKKWGLINNTCTLLQNSNCVLFKTKYGNGYPCFYCRESFVDFDVLKEHQAIYPKTALKLALEDFRVESLVVYAHVKDLKCTICDTEMINLDQLKTHLIDAHKKKFDPKYNDRVVPFKLVGSCFECVNINCNYKTETFSSIERHMNKHFSNSVCPECGAGFVTKRRMRTHLNSVHKTGSFPCKLCGKDFNSAARLRRHIDTVHEKVKKLKCPKCPERFLDYNVRANHMVSAHGETPLSYKCNVCTKSFTRKYSLTCHMRDHVIQKEVPCDLCAYACFSKDEMEVHMMQHKLESMQIICTICNKTFKRKRNYILHQRIHNNDKRHICKICGKKFLHYSTMKAHMKNGHELNE